MSSGSGDSGPSRWWVSLGEVEPTRVRLAHLHAVVSTWFDDDAIAHAAPAKPFALSPLRLRNGRPGFEIAALTDSAAQRFDQVVRPGCRLRLGGQIATIDDAPLLLASRSWNSMSLDKVDRAWTLNFVTPTAFRQGRRSSPFPAPAAVLRGLAQRWDAFSPVPLCGSPADAAFQVWVSDIDGESEVLKIAGVTFSGFVGRVRYQCDDSDAVRTVGPLFALAPLAGVGAATTKGLGTVRLEATWQPRGRLGAA